MRWNGACFWRWCHLGAVYALWQSSHFCCSIFILATSHRHRHHYRRRRRHHRRFRTSYVRMLTRTRTHTQSHTRMRMRTSCECHDIVHIDDVVYDFTDFLANPEGMILRSLERLLPNSITCNVYDDCIDYPPDDDDYDDEDYFGYMLIMVAHGVFVVSLGEPLCVRQYTQSHSQSHTRQHDGPSSFADDAHLFRRNDVRASCAMLPPRKTLQSSIAERRHCRRVVKL